MILNKFSLEGKAGIITGASKGLGKGMALFLAWLTHILSLIMVFGDSKLRKTLYHSTYMASCARSRSNCYHGKSFGSYLAWILVYTCKFPDGHLRSP